MYLIFPESHSASPESLSTLVAEVPLILRASSQHVRVNEWLDAGALGTRRGARAPVRLCVFPSQFFEAGSAGITHPALQMYKVGCRDTQGSVHTWTARDNEARTPFLLKLGSLWFISYWRLVSAWWASRSSEKAPFPSALWCPDSDF